MSILKNGTHFEFVWDMIVLQHKLDHVNEQSDYFKMAIKSHKDNLDDMKFRYNQFVDLINNNTESYFLLKIQELEDELQYIKTKYKPSFNMALWSHCTQKKINYYKEILQLKTQFVDKLQISDNLKYIFPKLNNDNETE